MPTERTPLRNDSNPPYVFLTNHNRTYKNKVRKFQCCVCAGLLAVFITALVVTVSYSVNRDIQDFNTTVTNSSSLQNLFLLSWPLQDQNYSDWEEPLPSSKEVEAALDIGQEGLRLRKAYEDKLPAMQRDTPSFRHQLSTKTSANATKLAEYGYIQDLASRELHKREREKKKRTSRRPSGRWPIESTEWLPKEVCEKKVTSECVASPYRTADGSCNNLVHPKSWGVAMRPFRRILPPDYADGISAPRKASDDGPLPSAREVSVTIHRPFYRDDPNFTVMLAVWGQFIDHDMTATALSQGKSGSAISCCFTYYQSGIKQHPECYTVSLGAGDPFYQQYNISCMEFVRSAPAPVCSFGPREQMNQASSFLDGSVVYGTNQELMNQLRTSIGGELKMLVTPSGEELLPVSVDPNDGCNREEEFNRGRYCFLSGDPRSNENIHLTSLHLLFARQHNLIARKLATVNPHWNDERLFQESRKIVAAQIQHVTYTEFLPVILGADLMDRLKISPLPSGYSTVYNNSVDPRIANSFASSAFRFGHSLLPGLMRLISNDSSSDEYVEFHKMLFNPFELYDREFLEKVVKGALSTPIEKVDTYFNKEMTEHLFEKKPSVGRPVQAPCGLDLVSLNIQRGRDHGLPGYPEWRKHCGLKKPESFEDLEDDVDSETLDLLKMLYRSVDDIDMYTGALAEIPLKGGLVGPTVTCLLADQFLRLKTGDRYWYETNIQPQAFTTDQLTEIRRSSLARIICDTSEVDQVQPLVMRTAKDGNKRQSCSELPGVDLDRWKEKDGNFVEVGMARVNLHSVNTHLQVIKTSDGKQPETINIEGSVIGGKAAAENSILWHGQLPLAIPTEHSKSATSSAHLLSWEGTVTATDDENGKIQGTFSLISLGIINGQAEIDFRYHSGKNISIKGAYYSPVYFSSEQLYEYLQYFTVHGVPPKATITPQLVEDISEVAPIILLGTFSNDSRVFLWSGNFTLVLPTTPAKPLPLNMAYTPKVHSSEVHAVALVQKGTIFVGKSQLWKNNLPLAIPLHIFTVSDGSDKAIPVLSLITWKGSFTSSILSGNFSVHQIKPSNGLTNESVVYYNGEFSFSLKFLEYSAKSLNVKPDNAYATSVVFEEQNRYIDLLNQSVASFNLDKHYDFSATSKIPQGTDRILVVLQGAYSKDEKNFIWSGHINLIITHFENISTKAFNNSFP